MCSNFIEKIENKLKEKDKDNKLRGITYNITEGNSYEILQTPILCGQDSIQKYYLLNENEKGAIGKNLLDAITKTISGAEKYIDISILYPFPNGKFLEAIKKGLEENKNSGVLVRILCGIPVFTTVTNKDLEEFLKQLGEKKQYTIYVALLHYSSPCKYHVSWNHSKIIAVDGKEVITGGHNLWNLDYFGEAPVHDVSIKVTGPAAKDAHCFLNKLWKNGYLYALYEDKIYKELILDKKEYPYYRRKKRQANIVYDILPDDIETSKMNSPKTGDIRMLSLGNLGFIGEGINEEIRNASVFARRIAFENATKTIKISQMDIGYMSIRIFKKHFDNTLMKNLANAIIKGVKVFIIMSDWGANSSILEPKFWEAYYCIGVESAAKKIKKYVADGLKNKENKNKAKDLITILNNNVHIAPLRLPGNKAKWKLNDGREIEPANHAKIYIIDDKYIYCGSDNMYPPNGECGCLQEFGYLFEEKNENNKFITEYWDKLWDYSSKAKFNWETNKLNEENK